MVGKQPGEPIQPLSDDELDAAVGGVGLPPQASGPGVGPASH